MPQTLMSESAAAAAATSSSSSLLLKSSSSSSSIHSHHHQHHKAQEIYLNNNSNTNTTTHKHKIETHRSSNQDAPKSKSNSGDGESDEDVLHVVTNVYTIPIIKSSSSTTNNNEHASSSSTSTTTSTMHNSMSIPIVLGEPRVEATRVRSTSTSSEKRTVIRRVVDSEKTQQLNQDLEQQQQNNTVKSKFQIRSIVEIYENQDENNSQQAKDVGYFNSNTQFNETITKEVIPDVKGTHTHKYSPQSRFLCPPSTF